MTLLQHLSQHNQNIKLWGNIHEKHKNEAVAAQCCIVGSGSSFLDCFGIVFGVSEM